MTEPVPLRRPNPAPVRPEDGPQNVSQEPGVIPGTDIIAPYTASLGGVVTILNMARTQLGYDELASGYSKYGAWYAKAIAHDSAFIDADWCDMTQAWIAAQSGLAATVGQFAYCPWHAQWFYDHGRWGHTPHPGDLVFYNWAGHLAIPNCEHVGIVEAVAANGYLTTIEGNTSTGGALTGVRRRVRNPAGVVVGYGTPAYTAPVPAVVPDPDLYAVVSAGA